MGRKSFAIYAQIALLAASGALAEQRFMQGDTFQSENDYAGDDECLLLDSERVGAMDDIFKNGSWVSDGDILKDQWESGTGIYAINYCVADDSKFGSVQIIVGTEERQVKLRKHGQQGGECRQWILQEGDYMRAVQWTWHMDMTGHNGVQQLVFQTHLGETRVIGREMGQKVNYDYNAFQPFIGLYTFEDAGVTLAVGAWEDNCHGQPKRLPFGFETFNLPSTAEVNGEYTEGSMTWVNEADGNSALENSMLDKAEDNEKVLDSIIPEPEKEDSVFDVEFIVNEPELNIVTPPPQEKETFSANIAQEIPVAEIQRETIQLQTQLEQVKQELVSKTDLLTERETEERVAENMTVRKEEDSDLAWTLFALMIVLVIFMSCIILVMCCYIRSQKKQRLNANDVQQRSVNPRVEESSDIESLDARKGPQAYLGMPRTSLNATPNADNSQMMMLGGAAPLGNYVNYQKDKENKADDVTGPEEVQLDFAQDQTEVNQNPARGVNPFESNAQLDQNDEDDDDGADLNMSEESARGPGMNVNNNDNYAVGANPNTRQ